VKRTWLRNINWCLSFGKVFPVASSDACWREVVNCFLERTSVVVIDVSYLRENVIWEIDQIKRLGVETNVLYLISADVADLSRATLELALGKAACADRLFLYERNGLIEPVKFTAMLAETVMRVSVGEGSLHATRSEVRLAIFATVAFVLGMIPVLALAFPVFADQLGLPRWNQWEHPAYWPGMAKIVNHEALATWLLLIIAAKRIQTLRFLIVIQSLLLLAAPIGMLDW
jgi:hypothetical protein